MQIHDTQIPQATKMKGRRLTHLAILSDHDMIKSLRVTWLTSWLCAQVCIKEARGLPPALSNFVFCQYAFWGHPEPTVIPPQVNADVNGLSKKRNDSMSFIFDHSNVSRALFVQLFHHELYLPTHHP